MSLFGKTQDAPALAVIEELAGGLEDTLTALTRSQDLLRQSADLVDSPNVIRSAQDCVDALDDYRISTEKLVHQSRRFVRVAKGGEW